MGDYIFPGLSQNNRNIAIHGTFIIDTSVDDHIFALDAATGRLAWETQVLDYRVNPAMQGSGPIIADGKVIAGRSCVPKGGPDACVITAPARACPFCLARERRHSVSLATWRRLPEAASAYADGQCGISMWARRRKVSLHDPRAPRQRIPRTRRLGRYGHSARGRLRGSGCRQPT